MRRCVPLLVAVLPIAACAPPAGDQTERVETVDVVGEESAVDLTSTDFAEEEVGIEIPGVVIEGDDPPYRP